MAGLQSIALAVAHLEQECGGELESVPTTEKPSLNNSNWGYHLTLDDRVPCRRGFEDGSPRVVSNDTSFVSDDSERSGALRDVGDAPPTPRDEYIDGLLSPPTMESLLEAEKSGPVPTPSPTEEITEILENDVLCGRGGETNHHVGNVRYRALVKFYQRLYLEAKRRDKPRIAREIVKTIRLRGGRFLKRDANSNVWKDVGNQRAREKTSQALREGAPELRSTQDDQAFQMSPKQTEFPQEVSSSDRRSPVATATENLAEVSPKKRQRISLDDLATLVTSAEIHNSAFLNPTMMVSSPGNQESPPFPTIVSGDDDDAGSDRSGSTPRGPRLRILKQRLMISDSSRSIR